MEIGDTLYQSGGFNFNIYIDVNDFPLSNFCHPSVAL